MMFVYAFLLTLGLLDRTSSTSVNRGSSNGVGTARVGNSPNAVSSTGVSSTGVSSTGVSSTGVSPTSVPPAVVSSTGVSSTGDPFTGNTSNIAVDDLQPVPFAYRTVEGRLVTYRCYSGYTHTAGNLTVTLDSNLEDVQLPVCSAVNLEAPVIVIKDQNGTCDASRNLRVQLGNGKWEINGLSFWIRTTNVGQTAEIGVLGIRVAVEGFPPATGSVCLDDEIENPGQINISCEEGTDVPVGNTISIRISYESSDSLKLCDIQVLGREIQTLEEECGHAPKIYGLRIISESFSAISATAVYACDEGFYHQSGAGQVQCTGNVTWSHPAITCSNEDNILNTNDKLYVEKDPTCPHDLVIFEFLNTSTYELSSVTISFNGSMASDFEVEVVVIDIMQNSTSSRECAVYESSSTAADPNPSPFTLYCKTRPLGQFLQLQFNSSIPESLEVRATGRQYTEALECMLTREGWDYKGQVNMTVSGATCRRWDSLPAHLAIPEEKFSANAPENYCRSPEGSDSVTGRVVRPWCYTTNNNATWEYCPVGQCSGGCVVDGLNIQYTGMIDVTASGKKCRSWKLDEVPFKMPSTFPDGVRNHNHCRNPGESMTKPWCYKGRQSLTAEVCNVGRCPTSPLTVTTGAVYFNRSITVFANIVECFFWNGDDAEPWVGHRWSSENGIERVYTHICNTQRSMAFLCSENLGTTIQWALGDMSCDATTTTTDTTVTITSTSGTTTTPTTLITGTSTGATTPDTTSAMTTTNTAAAPSTEATTPTTTTTTTTTPTTTSYNPFPVRKVEEICSCRCRDPSRPSGIEQVKEAAVSIKEELKVETKTLSKSIQKKKSSKDKRSSSTNMGFLAIALMCVVFGVVVIPDVVHATAAIYNIIRGM